MSGWSDLIKPEKVVPGLLMLLIGIVGFDGERMISRQDEQDKTNQSMLTQLASNTADISNLKMTTINNRLYIVAVDNRLRDLEGSTGRPNAYPPQYPPQYPERAPTPAPGPQKNDVIFDMPLAVKPERT